ncbi:hypothetical protein BDF20DRAFT_855149 [Mycotypha africana]|uniref:uncharacterized protein n=1 Tax=Mycotypha africana TaxID=64632 RepID=UPI002301E439|nr:uncharacterized protein BDF20DRAFT_855149 [Mycotypha africana]KAI8988329.1 hypothetical protein BDF20DRAFT_855149 [Mycotypha africana]
MLRFNYLLSMERLWYNPSRCGISALPTENIQPDRDNVQIVCTPSVQHDTTLREDKVVTNQLKCSSSSELRPSSLANVSKINSNPAETEMNDGQTRNTNDVQNRERVTTVIEANETTRLVNDTDKSPVTVKGKKKEMEEENTIITEEGPSIMVTAVTVDEPMALSVSTTSSILAPQTPSPIDSVLQHHHQRQQQQQQRKQHQQQQHHEDGCSLAKTLPIAPTVTATPLESRNTTASLFRRETTKLNRRRKSLTKKIKKVLSHSKMEIKRHSM